MLVKERKIGGVFEIQLDPHEDKRGFFMRVYDDTIFKKCGLHRNWVQENHSRSVEDGVIRGMHFQFPPYTETKLIRSISGEIYDVFIDLRKDSPTFRRWDSIKLSAENKKMIYIPRGFAHGFCTLTKNCEVVYKVKTKKGFKSIPYGLRSIRYRTYPPQGIRDEINIIEACFLKVSLVRCIIKPKRTVPPRIITLLNPKVT